MHKLSFLGKYGRIGKFACKRRRCDCQIKQFLRRHLKQQRKRKSKRSLGNEESWHIGSETVDWANRYDHRMKKFFSRGTRENFLHDGSFHKAIAPVLVMAQFFCLMPVRGVHTKYPKGLSFQWRSYRTWYCMLYMFATVIDTLLTVNMVSHGKLDVRNLEPVIFHLSILLASIGFLSLAMKWPHLMRSWQRVERQLPKYTNWIEREALARRIKNVSIVMFVLSLTEHLLSTISAIHFANYCPSRSDPVESYFYTVVTQIFLIVEYNTWLAWLGKIQNVLMTFGWSYMDVFVSIMGIGLSSLFRRVHNVMDDVIGQPMPKSFWTQVRTQYRAICELIIEVDAAISGIIMLSFANNLYFICIQLLKSMNKMPSVAHVIYFYFSLMFLIARTLAVCLFLSEVHDKSKHPLAVIQYLPTSAYNEEVERFSREVSTDFVALTGLRFFNITRGLALTVAGTIVTYELVLIQFHEDQKMWNCGPE